MAVVVGAESEPWVGQERVLVRLLFGRRRGLSWILPERWEVVNAPESGGQPNQETTS